MSIGRWRIPPSVARWMAEVPEGEPVAVLLRHSVRGPLPPGKAGYRLPITEEGSALARELGVLIGSRLKTLHASPLVRCMQTVEAIGAGAEVEVSAVRDRLLGDPSVYVIDGELAWSNWREQGHESVMRHLVSQDRPLPGMAHPGPAARFLVRHMLACAEGRPGLHLFVTHDLVVTATAARLLGQSFGADSWPWYLEGVFFWKQGGRLVTAYQDHCGRSDLAALASLDLGYVSDFARREAWKCRFGNSA